MKNIDITPVREKRFEPLLSRAPAIGLVLIILGSLLFATMAVELKVNGPVIQEDQSISQLTHREAEQTSKPLVDFIYLSSFWIGREVVMIASAGLALFWLYKRFWRGFWMILIGIGGGGTWWTLLVSLFNRHRPTFPDPIDKLSVPSFPSGHAISAVLFYGLAAYLLVPHLQSTAKKILVILACLLLILYVGWGRIWTGGHYLSDVIAGYAIGIAWGGLVYTAIDRYFARRKKTV
ncbi:MAG: phosphatase PAP2 family protein [Omnitrophica WOR_2 bacterium]